MEEINTHETKEENQPVEDASNADNTGNKFYNTSSKGEFLDNTPPFDDNRTDFGGSNNTTTNAEADKNDSERRDILDVFVEQINISDSGERQENNVGLYLKETTKDIFIDITNNNVNDEQKIIFNKFEDMHYRNQFIRSDLAYINNLIKPVYEKFQKTRIVVINNSLAENEMAMAALECILLKQNSFSDFNLYSCDCAKKNISISHIINSYKRYKKVKSAQSTRTKALIILYFNKDFAINANDLLRPILEKGGMADSVTYSLKTESLEIICMCNDRELYKTAIMERAHFGILHISKIHLIACKTIPNKELFFKLIPLMEKALGEYDWLSKLNSKEQEEKIVELITSGKLEQELDKIKSIDLEENKILIDLISNSLNNIVLFVASFFEGVDVTEFDSVVRALVLRLVQRKKTNTDLFKLNESFILWDIDGDSVLGQCGIKPYEEAGGLMSFQFESKSRKRNAVKIFLNNYSLHLLRSIDIIENLLVSGEEDYSKVFLIRYIELIFASSKAIQEKKLLSICLNITEQLNNSTLNEKQLKLLFRRLLLIVNMWSEKEDLRHSMIFFYQQMNETPFRRSILGAILTHNCTPDKPEKIFVLKLLLNSIGDTEYFIKFKVPRIIVLNYINEINSLQAAINEWADSTNITRLPRAFSFFKSSLLFLFYEKRYSHASESGLDYQLIKNATENVNSCCFTSLLAFLFAKNSVEIFNDVFEKDIHGMSRDKKLLSQLNTDSLYTVYSFILIRCQYLLQIIEKVTVIGDKGVSEKMKDLLLLVSTTVSMLKLRKALNNAVLKYNLLIRIEKEQTDNRHSDQKTVYINKRDGARTLIAFTEQFY